MKLEWRLQPDGVWKANLGEVEFLVTPDAILLSSFADLQQFSDVDTAKEAAEDYAEYGGEEEE